MKFSVSQSARQEVLHESSVSSHIDIQLLLVTLSGIKDFISELARGTLSLSIEINRYTTIHIINIMMYSTLLTWQWFMFQHALILVY